MLPSLFDVVRLAPLKHMMFRFVSLINNEKIFIARKIFNEFKKNNRCVRAWNMKISLSKDVKEFPGGLSDIMVQARG